MKTLKIIAGLIALLVVLAVAGVAYVAATFDPDTQRTRIIELVKEETGRQLRIDGDFKLTFFPRLGVVLGQVALSDKPASAARTQGGAKPAPFLQVDSARASLRILPLLTGRFAADRVVLTGLSGEFVRHRDGSTNFDDLLGTPSDSGKEAAAKDASATTGERDAAMAIPAFEVAGVEISGANIGWRDERDGSAIHLKDLSLQTGRIAAAVPGQLTVKTRIESSEPALALQAELLTGYVFDPATRVLHLTGFTALLRGDAPGVSGLDASFSSLAATFDGAARRVELKSLRLVVRDAAGLTATMTMPRLSVAPGLVDGEPAALAVQIENPARKLTAQLALSAPVMRAGVVNFERLTGKFQVSGPDLPSTGVALEFSGNAGLDWGKELGNVQLSARLDESTLKAKMHSRGFSPIVLDVEVNADRIDLDRYFPAQNATKSEKTPADTPVDLSGIAGLKGNFKLQAGTLRSRGVTVTKLNLGLRASGGKLEIEPLRAGLYGGTVQASARADAATGTLSANGVLSGIDVGPLLHDLAQSNILSGRGNARFALTSRGTSLAALRRELGGTASLALRDGAIKGFNLAQTIRKAKAAVGSSGTAAQAGSSDEQTDFSTLDASVVITNGVARNDDLNLKSPLLRVGGAGTVDIGAGSVDYLLKTTIVGTLAGQGGSELANLRGVTIPVRITGSFDKLSYRPDFSGAVADAAKQKLRSSIEQRLGIGKPANGTGDRPAPAKSPADLIKGLLGR